MALISRDKNTFSFWGDKMLSINFSNWITVGLMALFFFAVVKFVAKKFNVTVPGLS